DDQHGFKFAALYTLQHRLPRYPKFHSGLQHRQVLRRRALHEPCRNSSVMRICHGAPGVTCSPAMKPSASQRGIEDVFMPKIWAALRIETSSPVGGSEGGWNRGMLRYRRRLPTWLG